MRQGTCEGLIRWKRKLLLLLLLLLLLFDQIDTASMRANRQMYMYVSCEVRPKIDFTVITHSCYYPLDFATGSLAASKAGPQDPHSGGNTVINTVIYSDCFEWTPELVINSTSWKVLAVCGRYY